MYISIDLLFEYFTNDSVHLVTSTTSIARLCSLNQTSHIVSTRALANISRSAQGYCHIRVRIMVNLTGSCPNSINVDQYLFALQRRPTVLYTYVYVVIAMKPVHRLQIRPIVHNKGYPCHSQNYIRVCAMV